MKYTLVGELSKHIYCYVDSNYTHKVSCGNLPCVWFGVVSYPGRVWGCTVLLESGAIFRNIPPHAISFTKDCCVSWTPKDAQTWDCYGEEFTTIEYKYLSGLKCKALANKKEHIGEYLFTIAPVGDGFSAYPEQAKEFCFIKLNNDRLTIQPTNHVVFQEKSFTNDDLEFPKKIKRQFDIWKCEP